MLFISIFMYMFFQTYHIFEGLTSHEGINLGPEILCSLLFLTFIIFSLNFERDSNNRTMLHSYTDNFVKIHVIILIYKYIYYYFTPKATSLQLVILQLH
jgi:hypothetical protein